MCQLLGVKISRVSEISDEFVQWLHDFFGAIHGWSARRLPTAVAAPTAVGAECGFETSERDQGTSREPRSKIRDGSAERNERPRGAAVFDFQFCARYEP